MNYFKAHYTLGKLDAQHQAFQDGSECQGKKEIYKNVCFPPTHLLHARTKLNTLARNLETINFVCVCIYVRVVGSMMPLSLVIVPAECQLIM